MQLGKSGPGVQMREDWLIVTSTETKETVMWETDGNKRWIVSIILIMTLEDQKLLPESYLGLNRQDVLDLGHNPLSVFVLPSNLKERNKENYVFILVFCAVALLKITQV